MRIGRDRGHAGQAEIEHWYILTQRCAPRQNEAAETAIDVQAYSMLYGECGEFVDRIELTVQFR